MQFDKSFGDREPEPDAAVKTVPSGAQTVFTPEVLAAAEKLGPSAGVEQLVRELRGDADFRSCARRAASIPFPSRRSSY